MNSTASAATATPDVVSALVPALVDVIAIVLLGYVLARFKVLQSSAGATLGSWAGKVALPALLFRGMATLDFSAVDWVFLIAVLLGKLLVFLLAAGATYTMHRRRSRGDALKLAGLRGIYVTQSNDFALGLPIIKAVFDATHPSFSRMFYLTGPLQLCILNVMGFALLELGRMAAARETRASITTPASSSATSTPAASAMERSSNDGGGRGLWFRLLTGVLSNPVVSFTGLGLVCNAALGGTLPTVVDNFFGTIGDSFDAVALCNIGVSIALQPKAASAEDSCDGSGSGSGSGGGGRIVWMLNGCKIVLLPLLVKLFSDAQGGSSALGLLGFLYGCLPTAPSVYVFAQLYGVSDASFIPTAMLLGTVFSAPIMLVTAMLAQAVDYSASAFDTKYFYRDVTRPSSYVGLVSIAGLAWLGIGLLRRALHPWTRMRGAKEQGSDGADGAASLRELDAAAAMHDARVTSSTAGADTALFDSSVAGGAVVGACGNPDARPWPGATRRFVGALCVSQLMFPVASLFCASADGDDKGSVGDNLRFTFIFGGIMANRLWVAALAIDVALEAVAIEHSAARRLWRSRACTVAVHVVCWGAPIGVCAGLITVAEPMSAVETQSLCWFRFGAAQFACAVVVVALSMLVCIVSIMQVAHAAAALRAESDASQRASTVAGLRADVSGENVGAPGFVAAEVDTATSINTAPAQERRESAGLRGESLGLMAVLSGSLRSPTIDADAERLVLYNVVSCALGLFVTAAGVIDAAATEDKVGAVRIELTILDSVLNYAFGFVSFCVFGLHPDIARPHRQAAAAVLAALRACVPDSVAQRAARIDAYGSVMRWRSSRRLSWGGSDC